MDFKDKVAAFLRRELKIAGVFDRNYYNAVYKDISKHGIDPVKHYFEFGSKEGRQPNALFDPVYYRKKYLKGKDIIEPLYHYLSKEGRKNSPHPLFDVDFYLEQVEEDESEIKTTYLEHYLQIGWKKGYSPTPYFDPEFYLSENSDVRREKVNPFIHYLTFGEKEGRSPSLLIKMRIFDKPPQNQNENYSVYHSKTKLEYYATGSIRSENDYGEFLQRLTKIASHKPIAIFVSHDGSRTGAPLIVLEIAKRFKYNYDIQPINILLGGGEITDDFSALGPTYVTINPRSHQRELGREMEEILPKINDSALVGVFVNSAESRNILPAFKQFTAPIISLIHEFAEFYVGRSWDAIAEFSDLVVFPSTPVKDQAVEFADFDENKILIKGQGLLNNRFLEIDREEARELLISQVPQIDQDSIIILGCGTADPRKGVDFFVNIGLSYYANKKDQKDVYFVWLGMLVENDHLSWSLKDVKRAGLEDRILFIGPSSDPAPFFVGSDVFLMTSRADPFPCVVHEAMASHLPIMCFEGGGGFVEALENNSGIILPYGDFPKIIDELNKLIQEESYRKEIGGNARQRVIEHYNFSDYCHYLGHLIFKSGSAKIREILAEQAPQLTQPLEDYTRNDNKSVIFTLPSWEGVSGVNTFVENLIQELIKYEFDAYILFTYMKAEDLDEKQLDPPKVPYRFLNTTKDNSGYEAEYIWKSLKIYLELNSPCVFVPNYDYIASAISADLSNDIGILGVLHSDDVEHYEHAYRLGRYWNHTVYVSNLIADKMLAINPLLSERSSVIHYGIEQSLLDFDEIEKDKVFSIIYTGRIIQTQKRILDFVEIIEELDKRVEDFVFTFIGDGPELEELSEKLETFIESGKVKVLGRLPREKVFQELQKNHVFTLFSDFEGLPLSLLEAMSMGCVPVLTDIESGVREIVENERNGLISPLRDIESFVDNLEMLSRDQQLREKLSSEAFLTIERHSLNIEAMGKKYASIIESIFSEISESKFERPPALTFSSKYGNVLLPPMTQVAKRNFS